MCCTLLYILSVFLSLFYYIQSAFWMYFSVLYVSYGIFYSSAIHNLSFMTPYFLFISSLLQGCVCHFRGSDQAPSQHSSGRHTQGNT